jgi:hypothetical protein
MKLVVVIVAMVGVAAADPAPAPKSPPVVKKPQKEQELVVGGIKLDGKLRSPTLLYFLERANEELERASLERRSFIPHMTRSIDEQPL